MRLFQPDCDLPATRILFDTSALSARLRCWFGGLGRFSLTIDNVRYKPHTSCLVSYRLETADRAFPLHIKAFRKNDWPVRKQKLVQKHSDSGDNVRFDDDLSLALFRFPMDSELPAVKKFVEAPNRFLSRVLNPSLGEQRLADFERLSYKPNRRFTARLRFESGDIRVLKMHDASTFAQVLRSAEILKYSLPVDAPKRSGRSNRHRTLAYDWIPGSELDIATETTSQCQPLMELIFDFLDRLHCPLDNVHKNLEMRSPVVGVKIITDFLQQIYPDAAAMVRQISRDIRRNLDRDYRPTLVHGDFHPRQVIVSSEGIRACDFDDCCLGDPSSDLANFTAHLQYRCFLGEIAGHQVAQINQWSIRHVFDRDGREAMLRYRWNHVAAMFRLTTNWFRSAATDWIGETERWLLYLNQQIEGLKNHSSSVAISSSVAKWDPSQPRTGNVSTSVADDRPNLIQPILGDPAFETLAGALDPETAQCILQQVPRIRELYGRYEISNIDVVRHKPGRRCLIKFELATEQGLRAILGKASSKRLDRRAFEIQLRLFDEKGFGYENDDHVSVPRPIGYWAPGNMWFQEKVDAEEGGAFLKGRRLIPVTERLALAMAKLHSSGLVPGRRHQVSDELRILDDRLNRMKTNLPTEAYRIERIRKDCFAIGDAIHSTPAVSIHRDFYHDQVLFSDRQTFLVDLDLVSLGHPALDVGNFLAHLAEYGIRYFDNSEHWIQAENNIVDLYLSRMPHVKRADIDAFKAISFARHIFITWAILDRRKHISSIIDVAESMTTRWNQGTALMR